MTELLPIIVLGAGGHAKVLIDALIALKAQILGATDADQNTHGNSILGVPVLGGDDIIFEHDTNSVVLVNGIGSTGVTPHRKEIYHRFLNAGYTFQTIVHPSAIIGTETDISDGVQILAGAIIQPGCRIGSNSIINFSACVDHDCRIGTNIHIAPGVGLSGGVTVGDDAFIGAGATVLQYLSIGSGALIAAGATVVSDVSAGGRVAGVPARDM
jgi:sugar O-acyltransferase (sialic acid O-acetyltransferase NeuD family)